MSFPFHLNDENPTREDIVRLASLMNKRIMEIIPCRRVHFLSGDPKEGLVEEGCDGVPESWLMEARLAMDGKKVVVDKPSRRAYLPLWGGENVVAVAALEGCDEAVLSATEGWLLERSRLISRELTLVKKMSVEPTTGLLGMRHLWEELAHLLDERAFLEGNPSQGDSAAGFSLVLLEVPPRAPHAEKALVNIARASSCLESFIGDYSPPHYLGEGLFGSIWHDATREETLHLGKAVLRSLKREGFNRAHIGMVSIPPCCPSSVQEMLDAAWQALRTARKRGPHALCPFQSPQEAAAHPLREPKEDMMGAFHRLWRGKERFAVALVRQDGWTPETCSLGRITSLVGPNASVLPHDRGETYLFFENRTGEEAKTLLAGLLGKLSDNAGGSARSGELGFSAGVASYPYDRFQKSDIPRNARKALLHTSFFGPGTVTVFDGISLNISGDVYYNEGDLARAVREYRLGLRVDPSNVNLLNSLAVTYALMNRYGAAISLFEKALTIDSHNYMALFNLGHSLLAVGREDEALACFEKALAVESEHFDILLIVGELRCKKGRYAEAVDVLEKCEEAGRAEGAWRDAEAGDETNGIPRRGRRRVERGAVQRLLGKSFKALGKNREAMARLQRAIRFHPRDGEAMSLLAELYAMEKEGDDIALALCRKAIEIDQSQGGAWFSLGVVQYESGDPEAAAISLARSMQLQPRNAAAAYLLGKIHEEGGRIWRALPMFKRALRGDSGHREAAEALRRLQ